MALTAPAAAQEPEEPPLALAVKAVYLTKLAPFIQWPAGLPQEPTFHLCVAGGRPFGVLLDRAVRGQSVDGRPIQVIRLDRVAGQPDCRILFAAGEPDQSVAQILAALHGQPVLTVTDAARDPDARGVIHFVVIGERVRFEINDELAAEDGLSISSKLLTLATRVVPRAPQ